MLKNDGKPWFRENPASGMPNAFDISRSRLSGSLFGEAIGKLNRFRYKTCRNYNRSRETKQAGTEQNRLDSARGRARGVALGRRAG
ncbi:MAG TPA: hypothetical protein DEB39_05455 [Planctomycetaceae bacterium]|nr:hypothetical protein [Planctomycetaceae bacterium]